MSEEQDKKKGKWINRLNDLTPTEWIKFQKSWFIHNPPPREDAKILHPACFPETMIKEFIEFFTKRGQVVLDPMLGTGSTMLACFETGRSCIGIELLPKYAKIAEMRLEKLRCSKGLDLEGKTTGLFYKVIIEDARNLDNIDMPPIDYCITSPPYWDMLKRKGFETQKKRKEAGLDVCYSEDPRDLGNISDYEEFVNSVCEIFEKVYRKLKPGGYLTVIVKNVKKGGQMYPLAWDIGKKLSGLYQLRDEKIWCQDNQKLAPYGLGNAWVSNTFHHYCLNFRKPPKVNVKKI